MAQFAIEHLSENELLEAWPVIQISHEHATDGWWISEG